ncbi:MAG: PBP1A family penicillin-binding protein [Elusimicrobia bacterium]|nr:PBP1A family penicillin-binding protein [Elusimicrobiota bacterium]
MPPRKPKGITPFSLFALALGAMLLCLALYAERRLSRLVLGGLGESFSTRLYSAPARIEGSEPGPARLLWRIQRLRYAPASAPQLKEGEYSWKEPDLWIALRGFKTPRQLQPGGLFRLSWNGSQWWISDSSGMPAGAIFLEPELIAELSGATKIRREPAEFDELPRALREAVVSTEDKRFYRHWGIDPRAILRALKADLLGGGFIQGGSTITQQLSKNMFLSPRRTLTRKFAEALLALYLELRYSKNQILTLYLNHIYLGQDGPVSVAGAKAAARFYFGKELGALDLAECATLAGVIRSPFRYNPLRDPQAARQRRDFVLRKMLEQGFITQPQRAQAAAAALKLQPRSRLGRRSDADYFASETVRELLPRYGEDALFRHGLSIHTNMDPALQTAAQKAVARARPEGALVALDPHSGRVMALSGGRDYHQSQFNRATQAMRQPGSAFKPFVFGAALEAGMTPATALEDAPKRFSGWGQEWAPANFGEVYLGTATVRQALSLSLNLATLDAAKKTGVSAIIAFARRCGIESPLQSHLALALGSSELGLLELTAAYSPFANGGFRVAPTLVDAVTDAEGTVLEFSRYERHGAIDPPLAFLIHSLLRTVVEEGTARPLFQMGWSQPAAGKTGTTNDGRDAWFIGYTSRILAGVWVGDDRHRPINATGAGHALPIWALFMRETALDYVPEEFAEPHGLVTVRIDPLTGLRARSGCPSRVDELFLDGTEPLKDCRVHEGGVLGLFRRWFSRP